MSYTDSVAPEAHTSANRFYHTLHHIVVTITKATAQPGPIRGMS